MKEKIDMMKKIFGTRFETDSSSLIEEKALGSILREGTSYGGVYKGRKYMYSQNLIESLSFEKFESFIRGQVGIST